MEKLLNCPFCGKKDTVDFTTCVETEDCAHFEECPEEEPYYCVVCNIHKGGCGASGGFAPTRQEAVEKWDRRAAPENKPLTLEELRRMCKPTLTQLQQIEPYVPIWIVTLADKKISCQITRGLIKVDKRCKPPKEYIDAHIVGLLLSEYGKTWLAYARKPEGSRNEI